MGIHFGLSCGTLGEFYQGPSFCEPGDIGIVSPLIPKYSRVTFAFSGSEHSHVPSLAVTADTKWKMFDGIARFCRLNSVLPPEGTWFNSSDLPVGHGFASSTADIVAAIRCIARVYNLNPTPEDFIAVLSGIERSDSVFLPMTTFFSSSHHRILDSFRKRLKLTAVYMLDGADIDTQSRSLELQEFYIRRSKDYAPIFADLCHSIKTHDVSLLCRCATRSAELSQEISPKEQFNKFHTAMKRFEAAGLIVAHTGTILGFLFEGAFPESKRAELRQFIKNCGGLAQFVEIF